MNFFERIDILAHSILLHLKHDYHVVFGTAGGALLTLLSFNNNELIPRIILAVIGTIASFLTSVALKYIGIGIKMFIVYLSKKIKKRRGSKNG